MGTDFTIWEWFVLLQHELLLFAGVFFLIGAIDEIVVDLTWLWLKLTGRASTPVFDSDQLQKRQLAGWPAVMIAAWQEDAVLGATIQQILSRWPHAELRLYIGVYCNDVPTLMAAIAAANGDSRLRVVVHQSCGPTTKADCLNRLYQALEEDENRVGTRARMVLLHDAEDLVHPAALPVIDAAMDSSDLVQIPVLPVRVPSSPLVSGHYCEEFAEAHGKNLVVRDALGVAMPLAGVGCAIKRNALERLVTEHGEGRPFAQESITEDYELGINLSEQGMRARYLRAWNSDRELIATRCHFPTRLDASIRQKTRWIHGIALQGWDRIGWGGSFSEFWMRLRDRRGPLVALVLACGYLSLIMFGIRWLAHQFGVGSSIPLPPLLEVLILLNLFALGWRICWRVTFTVRHYGLGEGMLAIIRIPVANFISILAGRRAVFAYINTLLGKAVVWDKTRHDIHPAHKKKSSSTT